MEFDAFLFLHRRRHFLLLLHFSGIIFAAWGGTDIGRQNSAVFEAPLPGGHNANWKALCRAHKPPTGIGMAGAPGKIHVDLDLPLWVIGIPTNLLLALRFDRSKGFSCFKLSAITRSEIDKVLIAAVEYDRGKEGKKLNCRADIQWARREDGTIFEMPIKEVVKSNARKFFHFLRDKFWKKKDGDNPLGDMQKYLDKSSRDKIEEQMVENANDGGNELAEEMRPNAGTDPPSMVPLFDGQTAVVVQSIPEGAKQKDVKENVNINKNLNRRRRTGTNDSRKMPLQGFGRTNGKGVEKRPKMEDIGNERGKHHYNIREIFGRRKGKKDEDGKKAEMGGGMMNGGGRKKAAKNVSKNSKKIEPAENAMESGENDGEKENDEENGKKNVEEDEKRTAARMAQGRGGIGKPMLDLVKEVVKITVAISNQQSTKDGAAAAIDEKALLDLMAKNERISNLLEAISMRQMTAEEEAASCRRS